jgi:hypothetical protein
MKRSASRVVRVLAVAGAVAGFNAEAAVDSARIAARDRPRRIIFNNDGGETRVPPAPIPALDGFLPVRLSPLAGTQVDTIVFDTTAGTFNRFAHETRVAEPFLVQEGRYRHNLLPAHLAAGTDPLRVVIASARKTGQEVFWAMRMNDTHDATNPLLLSRLKQEHPDYLLGTKAQPPTRGMWTAVNYGLPVIRELARRTIAEVADRYDVDGIELDFWRHPVFFRRTADGHVVGDEERALMTTLLREVRTDLDAAGKRRGKPILLAVKTPDSVGYCAEIGLDLPRWFADDLIDFYIPGGYFQISPWSDSVALARQHGLKIYACLAENRIKDSEGHRERASTESLRGRASAAWAAGVDGIELFNHFDPTASHWREIGDPAVLRPLPKTYFASVQGVPTSRGFFPAQAHVSVPSLTPDAPEKIAPGTTRTYTLIVGDDLKDLPSLQGRLCLRVDSSGGNIAVRWDQQAVTLTPKGPRFLACVIDRTWVTPGRHTVAITATNDAIRLDDIILRIETLSRATP